MIFRGNWDQSIQSFNTTVAVNPDSALLRERSTRNCAGCCRAAWYEIPDVLWNTVERLSGRCWGNCARLSVPDVQIAESKYLESWNLVYNNIYIKLNGWFKDSMMTQYEYKVVKCRVVDKIIYTSWLAAMVAVQNMRKWLS